MVYRKRVFTTLNLSYPQCMDPLLEWKKGRDVVQGHMLVDRPKGDGIISTIHGNRCLDWDNVGHLQGSKRPLPRKLRKKSEKGFPGPFGPGVNNLEKSQKRVENEPKTRKILEK